MKAGGSLAVHPAKLMPAPPPAGAAARRPRRLSIAQRNPALTTPPAGNGATAVSPQLLEVMQNVANGVLTASDAALQLNQLVAHPGGGEAEVAQRAEFPEVVWGADKGAGHILTALQRIADRQGMAAATRVPPATAAEIVATAPEATYHTAARMLVLKSATTKQQKLPGSVALICAGTADATVVEECRLMLASCGCYAFKLAESGVMGMHRWGCAGGHWGLLEAGRAVEQAWLLLVAAEVEAVFAWLVGTLRAARSVPGLVQTDLTILPLLPAGLPCPALPCRRIVQNLDAVKAADVVICITGMDGGLASVVAGMVEVPVIALPTSTGYGTAFGGVAPMLAALNSSAPGVTVVNIDSGFGASMAAWRILKNAARIRQAVAAAAAAKA
jgi:NCAIR mutase (PurE)-related protein